MKSRKQQKKRKNRIQTERKDSRRGNDMKRVKMGVLLAGTMILLAGRTVPAGEMLAGFGAEPAAETQTENVLGNETEAVSESVAETADGMPAEAETETETEYDRTDPGPLEDILQTYVTPAEARGEKWAVSIQDLSTDRRYEYNEDVSMQSASVIKVFIMGAVYEYVCYPEDEDKKVVFKEGYEGELRSLLENMIRVSDNSAANRLVEILGSGDFEAGKEIVNTFCKDHGFKKTHLGRRFLAENPTDDNYTSSGDCRAFLEAIYKGKLINPEASEKMLDILRGQTLQYKIPSVLPEGYFCANKTGEMPEGYGLGCIENDIAIVFSPDRNYILAVLSNELGGRNNEAQQMIAHISASVAAWFTVH